MEKLWFKHYPHGVPHQINPDAHASLMDLFEQSCQDHTHNKAYSSHQTTISFDELNTLSLRFASYLQGLNLSKHARIAIMLPNCLQYPIALFGILRAGFIVVNTNPLYTTSEITHQLNDSGAEVIIILNHVAHALEASLPNLPHLKHIIITEFGDGFPFFKRMAFNWVLRFIKKVVPNYHLPTAKNYIDVLKLGANLPYTRPILNHQSIAFIQYTGGTTGVAKGAVLTHGNMVANVQQAASWIAPLGFNTNDTIITALPLYHIFSLTANCLTFLMLGARNILISNPRDISAFIKSIKHCGLTAITGVNTLFNALMNHKDFVNIDFSRLKLTLSGGMALHHHVAELWQTRTHAPILEAYGLTETSPAVTINPMDLKRFNGSIGLPLPSTDVSIRDDEGQEVPIETQGELCVKGPQVMAQYWKRPDETALVFYPDGFLKTGDIARMDHEGFIYLVDRKKDMILVSGFNVYPNEVEHVIGLMPEVLEVGVIGVRDEQGDERVKACIVKRDPNLTEAQVRAHCRKHLTGYKVPKIIAFYDELPKTNVGKILRRALK